MGWVKKVTGDSSVDVNDIHGSLKDGIVLCNLLNKIKPGTIRKVNNSKIKFMQMENVSQFIKKVREWGLKDADNFSTIDLYEAKDLNQVLQTLESLSRLSRTMGFKGPFIGVKESKENIREEKTGGSRIGLFERGAIEIHEKLKDFKSNEKASGHQKDYSHTHTRFKGSSPAKKGSSIGLFERHAIETHEKLKDFKSNEKASGHQKDYSHTHSRKTRVQAKGSSIPLHERNAIETHEKLKNFKSNEKASGHQKDYSHTHTRTATRKTTPSTSSPSGGSSSAAGGDDKYAQLEKLHSLKRKGILTQAEFDAEKKKILAA